jgi:hypothetical protein
MDTKQNEHEDAIPLVDIKRRFIAAKERGQKAAPVRPKVHLRQAGDRLRNKGEHQQKMEQPLGRSETLNSHYLYSSVQSDASSNPTENCAAKILSNPTG